MKSTSASVPSVPQTDEALNTQQTGEDADEPLTVSLSETLSLWLELIDPASAAYALADTLAPGHAQAIVDSDVPPTPTPLFRAHYENGRILRHLGCLTNTGGTDRLERLQFRASDAGAIVAAAIDAGQVRRPRFDSPCACQEEYEARLMMLFAEAAVERVRQDDVKHRMLAAPLELMEQRATLVAAQALAVSGRGR
jgi:hypothetical protein